MSDEEGTLTHGYTPTHTQTHTHTLDPDGGASPQMGPKDKEEATTTKSSKTIHEQTSIFKLAQDS